jgi:hypothetical protein
MQTDLLNKSFFSFKIMNASMIATTDLKLLPKAERELLE